jgi:hypothetical protein
MEAVSTYETSVNIYETTPRNIPKDLYWSHLNKTADCLNAANVDLESLLGGVSATSNKKFRIWLHKGTRRGFNASPYH